MVMRVWPSCSSNVNSTEKSSPTLRAAFGRGEQDPSGTVYDLEDAPVLVEVVIRWSQDDRPEAACPQVAPRLDDPPRVVGARPEPAA